MHIIEIRKFCCIYQIVKEVDPFQLTNSYNPFNAQRPICYHWIGLGQCERVTRPTMNQNARVIRVGNEKPGKARLCN